MNISFYCRKSKANRQGLSPIEVRITINHSSTMLALDRKENSEVFTKLSKQKKINDLKEYLEEVRALINRTLTSLMREGMPLTKENIKEYMKNGGHKKEDTVCDCFEMGLKTVKARLQSGLTTRTYEKYLMVKNDFLSYLGKRANESVKLLTNIDIENYVADLYARYDNATVKGKFQKVKYMLRFGQMEHICNGIKLKKVNARTEFLTEEEVQRIRLVDTGIERIEKVRDLFIFQCNTALAYKDMANLTRDDIQEKDGVKFINKERAKTGTVFFVPLTDEAISILEKYDYKLPVLSNQRMNAYLKEITILAHIKKNITSHMGRHTCATLLLNQGVPIEIVSKTLGHSNIAITNKVYAKLLDTTVIDSFKKNGLI